MIVIIEAKQWQNGDGDDGGRIMVKWMMMEAKWWQNGGKMDGDEGEMMVD